MGASGLIETCVGQCRDCDTFLWLDDECHKIIQENDLGLGLDLGLVFIS